MKLMVLLKYLFCFWVDMWKIYKSEHICILLQRQKFQQKTVLHPNSVNV